MPGPDKTEVGMYLPRDLVDELDARARDRGAAGRDDDNRSAVAADALQLGLVALQFYETEAPDMPDPSRRIALTDALQQHFERPDDDA